MLRISLSRCLRTLDGNIVGRDPLTAELDLHDFVKCAATIFEHRRISRNKKSFSAKDPCFVWSSRKICHDLHSRVGGPRN